MLLDTTLPAYPDAPRLVHRLGLFVRPGRPGVVRGFRNYGLPDHPHDEHEWVIDYQPSNDRFPAVASVELHSIPVAAGPPFLAHRYVVADFRRLTAPPPEVDFTLTAFGLPEPTVVPADWQPLDPPPEPKGEPTPPEGPPDDRWQYPAVAGIVLVGVVAFVRAGRRR